MQLDVIGIRSVHLPLVLQGSVIVSLSLTEIFDRYDEYEDEDDEYG